MKILIANLVINFVIFLIAVHFVPGVYVRNIWKAVTAAAVYSGLVLFAKPIMAFLAFPITFMTLGLFILVIDISIVFLTSYLVAGFRVNGWRPAIILFAVTSIASFLTKIIF